MGTPLNNPLPERPRFLDGTPALGPSKKRTMSLERSQLLQCSSYGLLPTPHSCTLGHMVTQQRHRDTVSHLS